MSVIPFTSITNRTSKSILVCFHWSIEIFLAIISTLNYSPASFPIKYTLCPLWFQPFGWLKMNLPSEIFFLNNRTLIWKKPFSDFLHPLLIFFMKISWQETGKLSTGRFLGFCGLLKTCFIFISDLTWLFYNIWTGFYIFPAFVLLSICWNRETAQKQPPI